MGDPIRLPLVTCLVSDFPLEGNRTLCSPSSGVCYTCPIVSSYLASSSQQGRQTCFILWVLILVIGTFGVVTNCLNLIILLTGKSPPCGPSLASLLIPLSIFDLIASGFAVSYSTFSMVILENMSRSWLTMNLYHISLVTYFLGRTGSLSIAILITVERYLAIAHPFKIKIWWSLHKTRIVAGFLCVLAIFCNFPRYFTVTLEENRDAKDISQLAGFPYLFKPSGLGILFLKKGKWIGRVHFVLDFLMPLPLLLLFNIALYSKITQANSQRRQLSPFQKSEIATAKMFAVVVAVLLLCHILPISFYIYLTFFKHLHREISFGTTLSVTVNTSVNFLIYFAYGKSFRRRIVQLLTNIFSKLIKPCYNNFSCSYNCRCSSGNDDKDIDTDNQEHSLTSNYKCNSHSSSEANYIGVDDDDGDNDGRDDDGDGVIQRETAFVNHIESDNQP